MVVKIMMIKKIIKRRIKRIINKIQRVVVQENNYSKSFSLPLILSYLDINIPENASILTHWSFSVFLFSLIALICFINVLVFLIVYILIQNGNYENKYPKFKKLINYYKKSSILYVIIEALICLSCLILLIIFSILYVLQGIS